MQHRYSIFQSVTLVRGVAPEAVWELVLERRRRYGDPTAFSRHKWENLSCGFHALRPLMLDGGDKCLFLIGKDQSMCVYSNREWGSASIASPVAYKLNCSTLQVFSVWPMEFYQRHSIQERLLKNRDMLLTRLVLIQLKERGPNIQKDRSMRLQVGAEGRVDFSSKGDLLPFETEATVDRLRREFEIEPGVVEGYINHFGWPLPGTPAFFDFVAYAELFALPDLFPDRALPDSAEKEVFSEI